MKTLITKYTEEIIKLKKTFEKYSIEGFIEGADITEAKIKVLTNVINDMEQF